MLQSLYVKNLALIDEIEVEFQKGLNILTGETGAGKSIILGSINLALGGRYHRDIIRHGAQYGLVELIFVPENEKQIRRLNDMDIFLEDGMVVLSRRLMEGRSVSKINGETVNMSILKEVASILIDIHGQHEHQTLINQKHQLSIIDEYAEREIKEILGLVKTTYREYKECLDEWQKANNDISERSKEQDFLEFEIQEIENANLTVGEDETLESDYKRMNHAKSIMEDVTSAYEMTGGMNSGASESLGRAIRYMLDAARYDEQAGKLCDQLSEIDALLSDFNRELSEYQLSLEFSQEEYRQVEERLNEINHLKTKYGNSIEQILTYLEERQARLQVLNNYEGYLEGLKTKLDQAERKLETYSDELSAVRRTQGEILSQAILRELQDLNFMDVQFEIQFRKTEHFSSNGRDEVSFAVSMNPGEPLKPLAEVASGGELSRIMLAIKAVMADKDQVETLIFDEIDTGISGRTAQKVSEKMAVIGDCRQVICITHLAQIASMADSHYLIEKTAENEKTKTGIRKLEEHEIIDELARILGGTRITDAVRENAREMRSLAEKFRNKN